jgi:signal transduction histidine kinase
MQQEALKTAVSEAERTIHILQDLLDLARGDSGYLPFQMESVNLNDLIAEVVAMACQSSDRPITLVSETYPLQAHIDSRRFQQVLLNLIDNAIKYSEPGTPILLKLNQLQERVILQVIDQGYGIPLQHQSRVFERFYRVDESRNQATGGCGLGLSIVKMLVEGMGGSISLQSKLGSGSIFTISLPANQLKSL